MRTAQMALVRARYIVNQSPYTQHRSYKPVKRLARYIAFGSHAFQTNVSPPVRGRWFDQNEAEQPHASVLQWAKHKVHRFHYDYAYQLLLSTRYGHLHITDFAQTLAQGTPLSGVYEWRLMVHHDTANQHAHAILFRKTRFQKADYLEWQQSMQHQLSRIQLSRWQELQKAQSSQWEQTV